MAKKTRRRNQSVRTDPDKAAEFRKERGDLLRRAQEVTDQKNWISAIQLLLNAAVAHGRAAVYEGEEYGVRAPMQWTYELANAMGLAGKKGLYPVEPDDEYAYEPIRDSEYEYRGDLGDREFRVEIPYMRGDELKTVELEGWLSRGGPIAFVTTEVWPPPFDVHWPVDAHILQVVPDAFLVYRVVAKDKHVSGSGIQEFYLIIDSKGKAHRFAGGRGGELTPIEDD